MRRLLLNNPAYLLRVLDQSNDAKQSQPIGKDQRTLVTCRASPLANTSHRSNVSCP
jgi:hypothetical protein